MKSSNYRLLHFIFCMFAYQQYISLKIFFNLKIQFFLLWFHRWEQQLFLKKRRKLIPLRFSSLAWKYVPLINTIYLILLSILKIYQNSTNAYNRYDWYTDYNNEIILYKYKELIFKRIIYKIIVFLIRSMVWFCTLISYVLILYKYMKYIYGKYPNHLKIFSQFPPFK